MPIEKIFRIPQRESQRHRVGETLAAFGGLVLLTALEQFLDIGPHLALHQVCAVQPPQQIDDFILSRRKFVEPPLHRGVKFLYRELAVHHADKLVSRGIEAVAAAGGGIFQQVPDQAAIIVSMDPYLLLQPRLQLRDPVPVRAVAAVTHAIPLKPVSVTSIPSDDAGQPCLDAGLD